MPCHNCGRTFLPDRLEVHLRSCDKSYALKKPSVNLPSITNNNHGSSINVDQVDSVRGLRESKDIGGGGGGSPDVRVKTKVESTCNLCGRQFSQEIMDQHTLTCKKRWVPG